MNLKWISEIQGSTRLAGSTRPCERDLIPESNFKMPIKVFTCALLSPFSCIGCERYALFSNHSGLMMFPFRNCVRVYESV